MCVEQVCGYPALDAAGPVVDSGVHDAGVDAAHVVGDGATAFPDGATGSCGPCNTPPDGCHALTGSCQGGVCEYDVVPGASCDDGNACTVNDTCSQTGVCQGTAKVCDAPPAASCNGNDSTTYDQTGACNGGLCVYTMHEATCAHACTNGTCGADACSGVTCSTPPSGCYAATGTCSNGSCSYAYQDGATCDDGNACTSTDSCETGVCQGVPKSCNTPPANTCKDTNTAQIYSATGSCSAGACSYSYGYMTCSTGCNSGVCNSAGWTTQASSTTAELLSVWGSSATSVWAGGVLVMLYYNGVAWEQRAAGLSTSNVVTSIHGTSASNVFAGLTGNPSARVIRYDGTSWSAGVTLSGTPRAVAVYAIGDDDVLVFSMSDTTSGTSSTLYRIQGGTLSTLTTVQYPDTAGDASPTIYATSATDVYLPGHPSQHWNGTSVSNIGGSSDYIQGFWATASGTLFANAETTVDELAGTTWTGLGYSPQEYVESISGTSASRIFAASENESGDGVIGVYDGTGWTTAVLPANTPSLNGIWASSTGPVFAVGRSGSIVTGP